MSLRRTIAVTIHSDSNIIDAYSRGISFYKVPKTKYVMVAMRERACFLKKKMALSYQEELVDYLRDELHKAVTNYGIKEQVVAVIKGPFPENIPQRSKFLC